MTTDRFMFWLQTGLFFYYRPVYVLTTDRFMFWLQTGLCLEKSQFPSLSFIPFSPFLQFFFCFWYCEPHKKTFLFYLNFEKNSSFFQKIISFQTFKGLKGKYWNYMFSRSRKAQVTFEEKPQLKTISFENYTHWNLILTWSDRVFKGTVVNQTFPSLHVGSLVITHTVPSRKLTNGNHSFRILLSTIYT